MYLIFFQSVKRFTVKRLSSTQQVAKKHLKRHVKRLRDREYTRLRQMVPSIAENEKVSKVNTLVLYVCFVDRCLSFGTFSFGHCVICSSSIYRFWLPLWYLQTLLNSSNMTCLINFLFFLWFYSVIFFLINVR